MRLGDSDGWFEIGSGNLYQLDRIKKKLLKIEIGTNVAESRSGEEKIYF